MMSVIIDKISIPSSDGVIANPNILCVDIGGTFDQGGHGQRCGSVDF